MLRCQVEGCNRGFDSAPRLRRHMKIHNKGECDQIVWLFYIVYMYLVYLPLKGDVLFFHVISRCLVVDFSFTYFGRKKGGQNDTTTGFSLCARSFDFWYINNFWVKILHACSSWSIRCVIPNYIIYWMFSLIFCLGYVCSVPGCAETFDKFSKLAIHVRSHGMKFSILVLINSSISDSFLIDGKKKFSN